MNERLEGAPREFYKNYDIQYLKSIKFVLIKNIFWSVSPRISHNITSLSSDTMWSPDPKLKAALISTFTYINNGWNDVKGVVRSDKLTKFIPQLCSSLQLYRAF